MTAPTLAHSAYPAAVEDLLPQARLLITDDGTVPSRNRLKTQLKVGAPKARALRDALTAEAAARQDRQDTVTYAAIRGSVMDPTQATRWVETGDPATLTTTTDPGPVATPTEPDVDPGHAPVADDVAEIPQAAPVVDPGTKIATVEAPAEVPVSVKVGRRPVVWPVLLLALPAFVAIWAGWVDLGSMTGFGEVNLLPGIVDNLRINTAITLPIGVETYAAYALWVWLAAHGISVQARRFAKWSAIGSLAVGALGQVAYHLMTAAGWSVAPWQITALVAALPVAVLGMGAALAHMVHSTDH
jgi:hypothetical protein